MPQVTVNGVGLSYGDSGGSGMPVLFIHAFPLRAEMWDAQVDALGDRWRAITPDLKGFGGSDAPDDADAYTMGSFADELKGLLDHLSIDRAVLVGLSLGGYVAFEFWRRYRGAVAGLVLADTRAEADPPEGIEKRTNQQGQVRADGTAGLIDALSQALLSQPTRDKKPDVVARAKALMDNPAVGFVGALEAMKKRPDSSGDLASIDVPTLVLVGEHDAVTPPDAARKLHEHVGGSRLVLVPEAGHLSNLEGPDVFNGALVEFLTELGGS